MQHQQIFNYTTTDNLVSSIRTIENVSRDNDVWFVAKDVCDILEISNPSKALSKLHPSEKDITFCDTPGGRQRVLIVSESGLYMLIFRSNKPEAERFRLWVTSEVLPSIRKTGSYSVKDSAADMTKPVPLSDRVVRATVSRTTKGIPQGIMKAAEKILDRTGLDEFQMTLALDEVFRQYTGNSVLELAGIKLVQQVTELTYEENCMDAIKTDWEWQHAYPKQHSIEYK